MLSNTLFETQGNSFLKHRGTEARRRGKREEGRGKREEGRIA
jgi:hypothetical protein